MSWQARVLAPTIRQDSEAWEVMQATITTVIVQFQQDEFCNKVAYSNWYSHWALADSAGAGTLPGQKRPWVLFLELPGNHLAAESLATRSNPGHFGEELAGVWEAFWAARAAAPERSF